jgi:hypothetical protein
MKKVIATIFACVISTSTFAALPHMHCKTIAENGTEFIIDIKTTKFVRDIARDRKSEMSIYNATVYGKTKLKDGKVTEGTEKGEIMYTYNPSQGFKSMHISMGSGITTTLTEMSGGHSTDPLIGMLGKGKTLSFDKKGQKGTTSKCID